MATLYTTEAGHVQWDPIDGTFDLPILLLYAFLRTFNLPPHVTLIVERRPLPF